MNNKKNSGPLILVCSVRKFLPDLFNDHAERYIVGIGDQSLELNHQVSALSSSANLGVWNDAAIATSS